jgi:nucleosome assembly protein 1-like 1
MVIIDESDGSDNEEMALIDGEEDIVLGEQDSDDESSQDDPLELLPVYVRERVDAARELHAEREQLVEQYLTERAALEQKYAALMEPLYEQRKRIVNGEKDDEIEQANKETRKEQPIEEDRVKGIPQFWVSAMTNNETIAEIMSEDDFDCLESLIDIKCENYEDGKGFKLHFYFAENEYFENTILSKSYDVPNLLVSDEPMLKSVKGTMIKWKPDRCLTYEMVKKKQRGKGKNAGHVRTVEKKEELESFFKWFEPPAMPESFDAMSEQEAENIEEVFDADYEVAQAFRSRLIPGAVQFFTGEIDGENMALALEAMEQAAMEALF